MALLGPNGAGKSTLLLLLQGVIEPQEGTILLAGQPVSYRRQEVWAWRQQIGLVLQNPDEQIFAPTVWQDLSFGPANLGWDEERICRQVEKALAAMELEAIKDRPTHQLSHGQKRRVAIAGVLAMEPRLLDEPTAGLDPEERQRFYRILAELGRDRIVLLSTHIVEDIATLCPRFAVIRDGRCVTSGGTSEARKRLDGRVFEGIVSPSELERVRATHRVTQAVLVEGSLFRTRVQGEEGSQPSGFVPVPPTLEDVYFGVMDESRATDASRAGAATAA